MAACWLEVVFFRLLANLLMSTRLNPIQLIRSFDFTACLRPVATHRPLPRPWPNLSTRADPPAAPTKLLPTAKTQTHTYVPLPQPIRKWDTNNYCNLSELKPHPPTKTQSTNTSPQPPSLPSPFEIQVPSRKLTANSKLPQIPNIQLPRRSTPAPSRKAIVCIPALKKLHA